MRKYCWFLLLNLFWCGSIYAAPLPLLKVAADVYSPPFIMRGASDQVFGFDIDMMEYICKMLGRTCQYNLMPFQDIIGSVANQSNDIGIGCITITLKRSKVVAFSIPYLLSYAQYLGLKQQNANQFTNESLKNKTVGVETGSVFKDIVNDLGMPSVKIIEYNKPSSVIAALKNKNVDFALMDSITAIYWQNQSTNNLVTLGKPFLYGFGFGIAVNKTNSKLLEQINTAILEYQNNGGFQKSYNEYIAQF